MRASRPPARPIRTRGSPAAGAAGLAGVIELPAALRARVSPECARLRDRARCGLDRGPAGGGQAPARLVVPAALRGRPGRLDDGTAAARARASGGARRLGRRPAYARSRPTPRPASTTSPPAARACGSCFNSACRRHPRVPAPPPSRARSSCWPTVLGVAAAAWSFVLLRAQSSPEALRRHLHRRRRLREPVDRLRSRCTIQRLTSVPVGRAGASCGAWPRPA